MKKKYIEFNPEKYTIRIETYYDQRSQKTNFVGFVAELKQIYTEANSVESAYHQIIEEIKTLKSHYDKKNLTFPKPIHEQEFSGKLNFRLGEELHRQIAEDAAKEGISINEYLIKKISA